MMKKGLLTLILLFPFSNAFSNGLDFRISSETAELTFLSEASTFGYGGADVGIGLFFNEGDDFIVSGSMLVSGSSTGEVKGLHFGVGLKAYLGALDVSNETGAALAIGARGRYVFPSSAPVAILLEVFVAPDVTSLIDFDGVTELRLGLEMEVSPSARAYIGYHDFKVNSDLLSGNKVDETLHFGVRFSF